MNEQTFSDHFFEPNRPPEEVLLSQRDRIVRIRFKTQADAVAFSNKTGILISAGDKNRISYPMGITLDEFF